MDHTYHLKYEEADKSRIQVMAAPERPGHYAILFTVPHVKPALFRSEISLLHPAAEEGLHERWYGAALYLPPDWDTRLKTGDIMLQWHALMGKERVDRDFPPLSINAYKNEWRVYLSYGTSARIQQTSFRIGKLATGEWVDWVIHVRWSDTAEGLIQIWRDGQLVFDHAGPNTYTLKTQHTPYFKTGIYHPQWKAGYPYVDPPSAIRKVYLTQIKIGNEAASYQDVAPDMNRE